MKEATPLLILSLALIALLLLSCAIIGFLLISQQQEPAQQANQTGQPGPNATGGAGNATPPSSVSSEDLAIWNQITNDNVEQACLSQARQEAGPSADLVYGCSCKETSSSGRKTFACNIATADPLTRYFANIDCFLSERACTVDTNYGTETLDFDQLNQWYGQ